MKRNTYLRLGFVSLIFVTAITIGIAHTPTKQERRLNLSLTEPEINVILQGLAELPMKTAQPVYSTIMQQAQAQLQPPKVRDSISKPKKQ